MNSKAVMENTYWLKQTTNEPLFPEIMWSRPENKIHAGKLLIIGGNRFGFASPGKAYMESIDAGIGNVRAILPMSVKKIAGNIFPSVEFADTNISGSFSKSALAMWLEQANWADGTLLAGDFGRNSEVAILLESFIVKYSGQLTLTNDAADYCIQLADTILHRDKTLLVLTIAQLQKIAIKLHHHTAIINSMDVIRLVDVLHEFTQLYPSIIVVKHLDKIFVAYNGRVSTTPHTEKLWRTKVSTHANVWWIQNPDKPFEAITSSLIDSI